MSRNYDNWERLVEAVLDREKLRQLAREPSFDSVTSDFSSRFSFDSTLHPEYVPVFGGLEAPKSFSYDELKKATRDFRPVRFLGEGGSLYDFKGWIDERTLTAVRPGSGLAITVKSMPEKFPNHDQWLFEKDDFPKFRHANLVKLMGYCFEGHNRFLVHEFMSRGSLEMNLLEYEPMPIRGRDLEMDSSGSRLNQILSWETRVNVAIDVARALCFLHDKRPSVIHGHVKASIILLDEDLNAKLEGFPSTKPDPVATLLARGDTVHPVVFGHGYRETETKADVYSFGIVLLQLLCGRPAFDRTREQDLMDWAEPHLSGKRKLSRIMDPKLRNQYSNEGARTLAAIALQCLSEEPKLRPSMTKVLADLERAAQMKLQKLKSKSRE